MAESNVKRVQSMFSEVQPHRGFDDIVLQIQESIFKGNLKPGDRLPNERELGGIFGVSRPTLREAIRSLEAAGYVEVRRGTNGGTFITEPKAEQVGESLSALIRFRGATAQELAEFRLSFESETAYWAAKRATEENKQRLREILEKLEEVVRGKQAPWDVFVDLDLAFHEQLAHAAQNQIRVAVMLAIHDVLKKSELAIGVVDDQDWREQQLADLKEIAEAVDQHRADEAKQLMRDHVERNVRITVGLEQNADTDE